MSIESGVTARLNAVTAITNLVASRIYADILPSGSAYPAIVYQVDSSVPIDSTLGADGSKFQSRVKFTLLADSKSVTIQLSEAMKTALQRFKGVTADITVLDSRLENIQDQAYDSQTSQTPRVVDFLIYWE